MTEAAIAEPSAAPEISETTEILETPNPISDAPREVPKEEAKGDEKSSIKDSIKRATAKLEGREKIAPAREALEAKKAAEKEGKAEEGDKPAEAKQPAKEGEKPAADKTAKVDKNDPHAVPARFATEAKAEWEKTHPHVRAETTRAIRELESGLTKYKESAEAYEPLRQYAELAKKNGVTLDKALANYVSLDTDLRAPDPQKRLAAIEKVLKVAGTTPQQFANYILGEGATVERPQPQQQESPQVQALMREIENLKGQLGQITSSVQSQTQAASVQQLQEWAADKPDLPDLLPDVDAFVEEGLSLDDAYQKAKINAREKARRLGFIPAPANPTPAETPQPRPAAKSISGSPSYGSDPSDTRPVPSIKEAVRRAMRQAV